MNKLMILVAMLVMTFTISAQVVEEKIIDPVVDPIETVNTVAITENVIKHDRKLSLVKNKLFDSKSSLGKTLDKVIIEEKARTGTVINKDATDMFLADLKAAFAKYESAFKTTQTVYVDKDELTAKKTELEAWKLRVSTDPEIKNYEDLKVWEDKEKELMEVDNRLSLIPVEKEIIETK